MSLIWGTVLWFAFLGFLAWLGEDGRRGLLLWAWGLMLLGCFITPFL